MLDFSGAHTESPPMVESNKPTGNFPLTVAAIRRAAELEKKHSAAQFAIGDALIAECGPPGDVGPNNGALAKLKRCAAELKALGFDYSIDHLQDLRTTAASFPDGDRSPSISWTAHSVAGDPKTLQAALRKAKSDGVPLTVSFVETFKKRKERGDAVGDLSPSDAERRFRELCADVRDLAKDAMYCRRMARANDADLMREAQAAANAWRRVADPESASAGISVRLSENEGEALAGCGILQKNSTTVGRVFREQVLTHHRAQELALAVDDAGAVVGCACFHKKLDGVVKLEQIAVARDWRRLGAASKMIAWLVECARARSATAIELKCTAENPANKFYEKSGFRHCGEEPGKKRPLVNWRMDLVTSVEQAYLEAAE